VITVATPDMTEAGKHRANEAECIKVEKLAGKNISCFNNLLLF